MNVREMLSLANDLGYIAGFSDILSAALEGRNEHVFVIIVCEDDEVAPRKIVDEYKHIGLNATWEKCSLATYKVGDDVVSKYFIRVTW